jgi:hypothetical protein
MRAEVDIFSCAPAVALDDFLFVVAKMSQFQMDQAGQQRKNVDLLRRRLLQACSHRLVGTRDSTVP